MNREIIKPLVVYILCIVITFACGAFAAQINDDFGSVEVLGIMAILAAMFSMLPLFLMLTQFRLFENLALPLKSKPKQLPPLNRNISFFTTIIVSGAAFAFFYLFGCGILPLPQTISDIITGNGFILWLLFLFFIALFSLRSWYLKGYGRKADWNFSDLGLDGQTEKDIKIIRPANRAKRLIPRAIIMAVLLTGSFFILLSIFATVFKNDFQLIRSFFFPVNLSRIGRFFACLPVYAAFFTLNAGVKLYGQHRMAELKYKGKKSPVLTQFSWWFYGILLILGGLIIVLLIEYILSSGVIKPQADSLFTPLFLGSFAQVLKTIICQFAVLLFFSTWLYRKSGTIYTGSFVLAILAAWIFSGSSVF